MLYFFTHFYDSGPFSAACQRKKPARGSFRGME